MPTVKAHIHQIFATLGVSRRTGAVLSMYRHLAPPPQTALDIVPSEEQIELLRHVARGRTNREIAAELGWEVPQVSRSVRETLQMLRVPGRLAAARVALERGWIDPEDILDAPRELPGRLPPRQLEALRLADRGLTHRQIAVEMECSINTVRNHLLEVSKVLGTSGRAATAEAARERGWID